MPVTAHFHDKTVPYRNANAHPSKPKGPQYDLRQRRDVNEEFAADNANELLNLRSKNIASMMAQREAGGYDAAPIQLPPHNPRIDALHRHLEIDKVVLVKSPFQIDTTPGGFYKSQALSQDMQNGGKGKLRDSWMPGARDAGMGGPSRQDAYEWSQDGVAVRAVTPDGRLLRGGWSVQ